MLTVVGLMVDCVGVSMTAPLATTSRHDKSRRVPIVPLLISRNVVLTWSRHSVGLTPVFAMLAIPTRCMASPYPPYVDTATHVDNARKNCDDALEKRKYEPPVISPLAVIAPQVSAPFVVFAVLV